MRSESGRCFWRDVWSSFVGSPEGSARVVGSPPSQLQVEGGLLRLHPHPPSILQLGYSVLTPRSPLASSPTACLPPSLQFNLFQTNKQRASKTRKLVNQTRTNMLQINVCDKEQKVGSFVTSKPPSYEPREEQGWSKSSPAPTRKV